MIENSYSPFIKQRKIFLPILILLGWLGFTLSIFLFGPYDYNVQNPILFYTYLVSLHIALFLGYFRGQQSKGRLLKVSFNPLKFIKICLAITTAYMILKLVITQGGDIRRINTALTDASEAYLTNSSKSVSAFSYIEMLIVPLTMLALTNGIVYFKKLSKRYKACLIFIILILLATSISSAVRTIIISTMVTGSAAFLLGVYKKTIVLKRIHKIVLWIVGIFLVVSFLVYSAFLTETRNAYTSYNMLTNEYPREDFLLYQVTPEIVHPLINGVSFYLGHSYYRLSQAFNMDSNGIGFGFTNSYFVMRNIELLTGWNEIENISYGARLDKGVGGGSGLYWATFYTWIASDFTFPGTVIVVFFIGYFFSISFKDVLTSFNPLAVGIFCNLFYFIFHFSFNNPMQDGAGVATYFILPMVWFFLRKNEAG